MLRLRLLGSFELKGPGDRPLRITARKARALLAFLALQNGAPQSRERLAALLWEDADAELARSSLRQALTALRRALPGEMAGAHRGGRAAGRAQPRAGPGGRPRAAHPARRGDAGFAEARAPARRGTPARGLRRALRRFEEWAAAERRTLRRELAAAAAKLAALCRDAGDADGEIDALNWLLALEPLAEAAHRELMACYARAGRYTEALRQYQVLRTVLRRELDLAPDPATESLYRDLMKKRRAGASGPLYALPGAEPEDEVATALAAETPAPATTDDRVLQTGVVLALRLPGLAAQRRTLDPEETRELTQQLQRLFDETVALHGGSADRLSGDRLVAVFGLENLTGNEPQRALRAAQAIIHAVGASDLTPGAPAAGIAQGALLPTRIDGPFPLSGDPMTDAESLAGSANPGEVLLSEGLRRALGAHNLPFAGRQAELSLMNSLLERCVATRRGRTIVTRGEAGIGKTRLLGALMDSARARGVACHRVQVLDFGQVKARRPLSALFASLLGFAADAGPAERGRAVVEAIESGRLPADSILHASGLVGAPLSADQASIERNVDPQALEHGRMAIVRQLIESACAQAPLLLVIEDLHYAGSEEAARLGELAASVVGQPALLVLSTRPDEDPIDAAWRARARGCPLTTLDLAPLTDEESRELAAGYGGLARGDDRRLHPPRARPSAVPRPAPARRRCGRDGDARLGAGARALARREARARRPADAARGVGAGPALSARGARGHAGRIARRAGPARRGRPAGARGRRDRVRARAHARGRVRLAPEVAAPRAARGRRRLVRRPRPGGARRPSRGSRRSRRRARLHRGGGGRGGFAAARPRARVRRPRLPARARARGSLPRALPARRAADAHRPHARRDRDAARGDRPAAGPARRGPRAPRARERAAGSSIATTRRWPRSSARRRCWRGSTARS